jgi:hypothetical protein
MADPLTELRAAVHQLLNYDTKAPFEVEHKVRCLMYGGAPALAALTDQSPIEPVQPDHASPMVSADAS